MIPEPIDMLSALEGEWQHAFVLTFGADLHYFERVVARRLGEGCRNRVVLMDALQLEHASEQYARTAKPSGMNRRYLVEGMLHRHAMHAKLVLVANEERGRLLVGSGNLGLSGYAGGGELFVRFDAEADADNVAFAPFSAALHVLDSLVRHGMAGPMVARRIQHMREHCEWLSFVGDDHGPLRCSLDTDLIESLVQAVGGEVVRELWMHAPFHDADCETVDTLVRRLMPESATLLIQDHLTSLSPDALARVAAAHDMHVRPVSASDAVAPEGNPYLHAKFVIARTDSADVVLMGSANLSRVAMLHSGASANVELAVTQRLDAGAAKAILGGLDLEAPVTDPSKITAAQLPAGDEPDPFRIRVRRAELVGNELFVQLAKAWDSDGSAVVHIGAISVEVASAAQVTNIAFPLPAEAVARLLDGDPVQVEDAGRANSISAPFFPALRDRLDSVLEGTTTAMSLDSMSRFEYAHEGELVQLLDGLLGSLVLERSDVVGGAGVRQKRSAEDTPSPAISYDDIDLDLVRRDPRIRRYGEPGRPTSGGIARALEAIRMGLGSFGRPVNALAAMAMEHDDVLAAIGEEELDDEVVDEIEDEDEAEEAVERVEKERLRAERLLVRRVEDLLTRFLRGISDDQYREWVPDRVVAINAQVLLFVATRCIARGWIRDETARKLIVNAVDIIDQAISNIDDDQPYAQTLGVVEQIACLEWVARVPVSADDEDELRCRARGQVRKLVAAHPEAIDEPHLEAARALSEKLSGDPVTTVDARRLLAQALAFQPWHEQRSTIAAILDTSPQTVQREATSFQRGSVRLVTVRLSTPPTADQMHEVLSELRAADPYANYHHVRTETDSGSQSTALMTIDPAYTLVFIPDNGVDAEQNEPVAMASRAWSEAMAVLLHDDDPVAAARNPLEEPGGRRSSPSTHRSRNGAALGVGRR